MDEFSCKLKSGSLGSMKDGIKRPIYTPSTAIPLLKQGSNNFCVDMSNDNEFHGKMVPVGIAIIVLLGLGSTRIG